MQIITKRKLAEVNGTPQPDLISRTTDYIAYRPQQPAFAVLDHDSKGMPPAVRDKLRQAGDFWAALLSVVPELATAARVRRASTSAGLRRSDTGEQVPGSDGVHVFVAVQDGSDIGRFLKALHVRCWLHGLGWLMVGAGGQMLERSIVDRMVGAPERLVFEGAPVLEPPLEQDAASRRPIARDGSNLNTLAACPPLTILENARLEELLAKEKHRLAPDAARAKTEFMDCQSRTLSQRTGMAAEDAARVVATQCEGILLPDVVLPFDDEDLAGATVADVLTDPDRFVDATLADPLEGVEYGPCKAKIMRRADGTLWINSFAHGRTVYELKFNAKSVEAALDKTADDRLVDVWVRMALGAELTEDEAEALRNLVAARARVNKTTLNKRLKTARAKQGQQQREEERNRRIAERRDPRPQILAPARDAPWLPVMQMLNDVLGACRAPEPPMRDVDGAFVQVRVRLVPNMHALTAAGVNDGDPEETRLPAPEQPLLTRLTEAQLGELIERHIEYVAFGDLHPVHLDGQFVRHFQNRTDHALPIVAAIATLPIVLPDGSILAGRGLDRERGIVFRVPPELLTMLPKREGCTATAVAAAMRFLTDVWLVDVATDYTGKCILIAVALTLIERSLLPDRPVFFVTAGRRGGGKTTTLIMLLMAITGVRPAAAAWSPTRKSAARHCSPI